jgi:2-C-methyl-D-erythritol 4-phosphate cytidylyltransferase
VNVAGIVVAAGRGTRFGGPKHIADLAGEPLWRRARDALLQGGCEYTVVVADLPGAVPGGERRRDSVAAGLRALPGEVEFVLVHDAARAMAGPDLARAVIARLRAGGCDGVVPAVPLRDTIKAVDGEVVTATVDRAGLVLVQTPQGFRAAALRAAHASGSEDASDDAVLVERAGGRVVTVPGEVTNLKITYPEDLRLAEALFR